MQTTSNYGYNLVESTDTCNVPVQLSPNFTNIDTDLKAVSDRALGDAVDTFSSNVHALVRSDADRNMFFFIAPADYVSGDTFTLDGVSINAVDAAGNSLEDNAFRINSTVLCIVYGTRLTLYVDKQIASLTAANIIYDNSISGLTATDVQNAIDELVANMPVVPASYAASAITYNNAISGLTATDVQNAIDELKSLIASHQYITTGLEINAGRCNILDGGYYIDPNSGIVYVDITIYTLTAIAAGGFIIKGFPNAAVVNGTSPHGITPAYNGMMMMHAAAADPTIAGAATNLSSGVTIHYTASYVMA